MNSKAGTKEWLDQIVEEIIDPHRSIIDPHHHLWSNKTRHPYLLEDLWGDTESGHNIEKTVFLECGADYRESGPDPLKPVGETEFVADIAAQSATDSTKATIAGIIGHADLTLGDKLVEVLDAHETAGNGLFRGIRHGGAHHPYPEEAFIAGDSPIGLFREKKFQEGVRLLGRKGYTYEAWFYHFQIPEFTALAKTAPDTTMIIDHFGTPLGTKSYLAKREEIYEQWKRDIAELAQCPNVYAKLGGLAMPDNGFGWDKEDRPPTSDEFIRAQKRYYLHTIECFGIDRCMFESNFPVDKFSLSYHVFWNACKKMTKNFSEDEKQALFYESAQNVYQI